MKYLLLLFFASVVPCCNCDDDDISVPPPSCGTEVRIDPSGDWRNGPQVTRLTVNGVEGTCIDISYGVSGCDSESARAFLFTTGEVAESLPTQTSVALHQDSTQAISCLAFFERRDTFDVELYVGSEPTILTIEGADTTLRINE
ncbi:hypothetical protein [Lewinella sp. 4G2]|uniref:hypothetical protein n=1 Tax=Lewinella sp. 4G2 TaxID=1803372 RepID=UPI0007B4634E|nr:hypothetical protein [Lewinella sp. 4G2]OAV42821.1 hypothetical protein A3850_016450 [Lewinella sp. 4G2]